ncbi:MAG TPA: MerR family transcriptional regulator [Kineosporiaceae bacterium]
MQKKDHLTLDDLSAATGMTARNVRAYQTKGLIPPPVRQGRRSMYGLEHLRRLQAIERARARGASLSLIATHLAEGRSLDEETVIGWPTAPGHRADAADERADRRTEIGPLLAQLDHQRDPGAKAQLEELIAAGIFHQEGRRVYADRDLAAALTALQGQGLPIRAALGVAGRTMAAAAPVADAVRQAIAELDVHEDQVTGHLGEVASRVVRQVIRACLAD